MTDNSIDPRDTEIAQEAETQEPVKNRKQRRFEERLKKKVSKNTLPEVERAIDWATNFIESSLTKYSVAVNEFLTKHEGVPAVGIRFKMLIDTEVAVKPESIQSLVNIPEDVIKTETGDIKITYIRITKELSLKPGHGLQAREEAGEVMESENIMQQLFYHAVIPVKDGSKLAIANYKFRLLDDFISRLIFNGIEFQEKLKEDAYDNYVRTATDEIKQKAAEVNDIFAKATEMKIED